jgi:3-oxoadipate enol-lactonase
MAPELTLTRLAGAEGRGPLLVVGPSLGTSVVALWGDCARQLGGSFDVVGWDLPGHGASAPAGGAYTVVDLADAVRRAAADRAGPRAAGYAGVSLGGAVAFELAVRPGPFAAVSAIASAPRIGVPGDWHERADLVRRAGTAALVDASERRWFAPGFTARQPRTAAALLASLARADRSSYAWACEALAGFDARAVVGSAAVPVHVVAGERDPVVPPAVAARIPAASHHVLAGCAHLPPAEVPVATAALLSRLFDTVEAPR